MKTLKICGLCGFKSPVGGHWGYCSAAVAGDPTIAPPRGVTFDLKPDPGTEYEFALSNARLEGWNAGVRAMADLVWNDLERNIDVLAGKLYRQGPKTGSPYAAFPYAKCDGNHAAPICPDSECWRRDP